MPSASNTPLRSSDPGEAAAVFVAAPPPIDAVQVKPQPKAVVPANALAQVLVIEDDPSSARLFEAHLSACGYRTRVAHDAQQARLLLEEETPDLILCDVCLPGQDGIQLTRWIRAQGWTAPIVLVTSADDSKILARGLEAGADDFLRKPVNSLELRTRADLLLRNKLLTDELIAREQAAVHFGPSGAADARRQQAFSAAQTANEVPQRQSTVLIIEDNAKECRLLEAYLGELNVRIETASDSVSGRVALERESPDLLLLDLLLPDGNGYAMIEYIKTSETLANIPILVVSAMSQVHDRVKALELGADDFIVKGFERIEFEARVRRLLRLKHSLDALGNRCDQALRQAVTDSLTGLFTHGFLRETLASQLSCARRYGWSLSLIFADIDHFKQINDRWGHATGDEVLKSIAHVMHEAVRSSDSVVRYGGEEFVILMPHTSPDDAKILAERVRSSIEALSFARPDGSPFRVTASFGISSCPQTGTDAETLLERADEAMYLAKQAGRNRVIVYGDQAQASTDEPTILIVDDDEKNLRLLEAYLAPERYRTIKARDGIEAVEMARRHRPDLILLDAMMPHVSGFDACRRLKQEEATRLIPVVLVTALSGRDDRLRGIEAGADDFLSKPIDKVELLTRTRALLRAKRVTDLLEDAETVIFTLARAVESRDLCTGEHVERVAALAVELGKALGLPPGELEALRRAGVVHDIGKILIPDAVLLKPDKLTAEERKVIERHVEAGYELLRPLRTFSSSLDAVRYHHERLDGSGYPFGLRGDQIPLTAQILAVVDVYDAITTPRAYHDVLDKDAAAAVLRDEANRGLHDTQLVETFLTTVVG